MDEKERKKKNSRWSLLKHSFRHNWLGHFVRVIVWEKQGACAINQRTLEEDKTCDFEVVHTGETFPNFSNVTDLSNANKINK